MNPEHPVLCKSNEVAVMLTAKRDGIAESEDTIRGSVKLSQLAGIAK
jgi:hypothetical protein